MSILALACGFALGSATATGQSATAAGPSASKTAPPLVVAKLKSAKKVYIALVRTSGYAPPRASSDLKQYWYQDSDYFREQIINNVEMWRLYKVMPVAAGADLVFEPSIEAGAVRVTVRDPATQSVLWMFSREVKHAFLPPNEDKNFAEAIPALLDDIRQAAGQPIAATQPAESVSPAAPSAAALPKVFISNVAAGSDDQAYNKFYAAIKATGRFELVPTPAQADLIFEACYIDAWRTKITPSQDHHKTTYDETALRYYQLKLVIWDRRTRVTLLATTEPVGDGLFSTANDKNFSTSLATVIREAEIAAGPPGTKPSSVAISFPHKIQAAPLPSQIGSATKVFVAKPGEGRVYPSDAALLFYDSIQTGVKNWGRYQLVTKAADADLVVEPSVAGGLFRLNVLDPDTSIMLWAFNVGTGGDTLSPTSINSSVRSASAGLINSLRAMEGQASDTNANAEAEATKGSSNGSPSPAATAQLAVARKVFLSNEARDRPGYDQEDNELVFNKVRDAIKAWGKYELAPTSAEADLVLDPSIQEFNLQLAVINPKAGGRVWTFTQQAQKAGLYTTRQRNIGNAAVALIESMRTAETQGNATVAQPAPPAQQPE